jgi:hypothetical protein
MKIVLKFVIVSLVTALLTISTPAQILTFIAACALLGLAVVRRKQQAQADDETGPRPARVSRARFV